MNILMPNLIFFLKTLAMQFFQVFCKSNVNRTRDSEETPSVTCLIPYIKCLYSYIAKFFKTIKKRQVNNFYNFASNNIGWWFEKLVKSKECDFI